ncbi:MAG: 4-hydroxy-3-methylbut-2-enyl diphosphate reductase [Candidatus Brocadiia bacterium]|nr:4-hydroxy-3-methylbut-2-enyl diphosphate reductase [Candidatus Brocadiia bacterium]
MPREKLEIILADAAGFCMGVRRALKLALGATRDPHCPRPIATEGPLIHNPQVQQVLEAGRVGVLDGKGPGDSGDERGPQGSRAGTVVIRAHGVAPERAEELRGSGTRVIDATCPHVRQLQRIATRVAEHDGGGGGVAPLLVVVGDRGHAEVEGVRSHAAGRAVVVSSIEDVDRLADSEGGEDLHRAPILVVAQTTQDEESFRRIAEELKRRFPRCEVFDTICRSTKLRQAEARELALRVETMVVVGGFTSANTRRLAQICADTGTLTCHVETDEQLDLESLLRCKRIGITAGASTPHWMIRRVIHRLRSEHARRRRPILHLLRTILLAPIRANLFLGGGAAAMVFVNYRLIPQSQLPQHRLGLCMALALFFLLGQHLLHQCARREALYLTVPGKGDFFRANARALQFVGVGSGVLAIFLALLLPGWVPFALVVAGTLGGWFYALELGPHEEARRRLPGARWLALVPGGKELFVGLAWAVTTALAPALAGAGPDPARWGAVGAAMAFCFLLGSHRMLLTDLLDFEGDQLVGRENLAVVLGETACKRLILGLMGAEAVLLLMGALVLGWTMGLGFAMLIPLAYWGVCFLLLHRGKLPEGEPAEVMIDAVFYGCGLMALAGFLMR